ncbi:MAG: HDOD domain-containing protein [Desulfobacteraceae bacterium]|nr:HDOD domain-containing protein [Desulfobacteraceae bacterium]
MAAMQELLKEIKKLKPIPAIVNQIIAIVDSPDSSMKDIAKIIKYDPAVTANLLKISNSAYFGLKEPAESIEDAVTLLGIDQIVELVLMKSGASALAGKFDGYGFTEGALWKYSVSSALIAKQIASRLSMENKNTIFTASLLKDIGKTILDKFVADSFEQINTLVLNQNMTFIGAEKEVIGVDHAELGGMIAKIWKFSPKMVHIIRNHHFQDYSVSKDKDIAVVYFADCVCMMLGIGVGADDLAYRYHKEVMEELGINDNEMPEIIVEFSENMQKVEELLNIV